MANTFSKVISYIIEKGERILKVKEYGTKTAYEAAPFGVDSGPLENMTAIYARTGNDAEQIIVGYINTNQLAKPGELRLYSMDKTKAEKTFIYLQDNGVVLINGSDYSAVRFENLQRDFNTHTQLLNTELTKIQTAISTLGGAYAKTDVTSDITSAKSETIKIK